MAFFWCCEAASYHTPKDRQSEALANISDLIVFKGWCILQLGKKQRVGMRTGRKDPPALLHPAVHLSEILVLDELVLMRFLCWMNWCGCDSGVG